MSNYLPQKVNPMLVMLKDDILRVLASHIQAMLLTSKLGLPIKHDKDSCIDICTDNQFNIMFKQNLNHERTPYIPCVSCKEEIVTFLHKLLEKTECEIEIVISMLLLFKRILEKNKQTLKLEIDNLKPLLFISFYISQKVIDDISIKHSEYVSIWKEVSPEHELISVVEFSKIEKHFLENIQWKVNISETTFYLFEYELYIYICYQNNYISTKYPQLFTWYPFQCLQPISYNTYIYMPRLYIHYGKTKFTSSLIPNCLIPTRQNSNKQQTNKSKKRKHDEIVKITSTLPEEEFLVKSLRPDGPYNPYVPHIY